MSQDAVAQADFAAAPELIEIYADGACKGNPGVGGWGVWLRYGDHEKELFGGEIHTTNNRMELTAVIRALEAIKRSVPVIIHTDSLYVKKGITEWLPTWKRKNWRTADGKPVKNVDLWRELDLLASRHQILWRWVRGHSGDVGNDRADQLANRGVETIRGGSA
ncbi:MAG: ribonuclease HI [Burkholderiales bacterium]|nr:ribonuclease HI [Burkholderiales bacterium]